MKDSLFTPDTTSTEVWSVVVVYEDLPTRERAMSACDQLVNQFWPEVEFKFHWWRTDFLEDEGMAGTAAEYAAQSNIIIFSGGTEKGLSRRVGKWFEGWTRANGSEDKALFDLTQTGLITNDKKVWLQQLCACSGVEYLTEALPTTNFRVTVPCRSVRPAEPVSATPNRLMQPVAGPVFAQARL